MKKEEKNTFEVAYTVNSETEKHLYQGALSLIPDLAEYCGSKADQIENPIMVLTLLQQAALMTKSDGMINKRDFLNVASKAWDACQKVTVN